jgi:hypothetical protein
MRTEYTLKTTNDKDLEVVQEVQKVWSVRHGFVAAPGWWRKKNEMKYSAKE